jgi:hypothetical protein
MEVAVCYTVIEAETTEQDGYEASLDAFWSTALRSLLPGQHKRFISTARTDPINFFSSVNKMAQSPFHGWTTTFFDVERRVNGLWNTS